MRANSLALRLFLSATVWTVAHPGRRPASCCRRSIAQAVERAFDRRLGVYLKTLIADVASPEDSQRESRPVARRAAVRTAAVGLVLAGHAASTRRSRRCTPRARCGTACCRACRTWASSPAPTASRKSYVPGPEDQRLRLVERMIDLGEEGRFLVAVAGDAAGDRRGDRARSTARWR